ncbi:MAG: hypothetical protein V8Q30_08805, partial [Acutalibacteraceae bacterium]
RAMWRPLPCGDLPAHLRGGNDIIIPNGNISQVINYTRGGYTAVVSVKVPFTMDADTVLEAVRLAAERACAGNPDVIEPPKLRGVTAFNHTAMRSQRQPR